ncbi:MAG: divergent polysaccharide deacetylase family protein [Inquilinaceae bacterium]
MSRNRQHRRHRSARGGPSGWRGGRGARRVAAIIVLAGVLALGAIILMSPDPPPSDRVAVAPAESLTPAAGSVSAPAGADGYRTEARGGSAAGWTLPKRSPGPSAPIPRATPDTLSEPPAWQRHAVAMPDDGRPRVAIVIDDLGVDRGRTDAIVSLPGPLTLSFLAYAEDLPDQTRRARAWGHELMLHLPMEPDADADPGPNALFVALPPHEIARRLTWNLDRFDGYVGVNNHMGSRFSAHGPGMEQVLTELAARGLLYLDSRTSAATAAPFIAPGLGVPFAERNVFLDNDPAPAAILAALEALEAVALVRGTAVGIGHPYPETAGVLAGWLPTLEAKGLVLVPISAVVRTYPDDWEADGREAARVTE